MVLGYGMGRFSKTTTDDAKRINRFAMSVLLPVMVFGLLANAPIHQFSLTSVAVYGVVELIVFAFSFWLALVVFKRQPDEAVLLGFATIFANNAFIVLPISIFLYSEANVLPITSVMTLDATLAFGGSLIALQMIKLGRVSVGALAHTFATTPMLHAIVFGIAFSLLRISMPSSLQTFIQFNGVAAAPVALFAMGVVLSQTSLRPTAAVITFSFIKLVIFTFGVWLGLEWLTSHDPQRSMFVLSASGPSGAMAFSLALLYGVRTDTITQIIVWTSVLSTISMAILA